MSASIPVPATALDIASSRTVLTTPSMDNPAKAFPGRRRSPGCGHFAVGLLLKSYLQAVRVVLAANKTGGLCAGAQWRSGFVDGDLLWHDFQLVQSCLRSSGHQARYVR